MKGSLIKTIAAAVFIPTLILMGISGYFLYKNYEKFQNVKKQQLYLQLTQKLETMLVYLGQERGVSSIYSVSKGSYPNSKKLLKSKREHFSEAIEAVKNFVNAHPEMYNDVKDVIEYSNKLPEIRKKVDSFKQNYIKTYFFTYYTVLESKIMNAIAHIQSRFPQSLQKLYTLKFPFEKIISYSGIIRGFGSYYITADAPMSEKEYTNVLMKYFHDTNILPTELLTNKEKEYLNNSDFQNIEKNIKVILFFIQEANMQYYLTKNFEGYPIDAIDYFNLFTKRISYFKKILNDINDKILNDIKVISKEASKNLIINAIILGLSILMFVLGVFILNLIKGHIKELSDLITSLTPITGKKETIDVSSAKGMHEAIEIVNKAIQITQEAIKESEEARKKTEEAAKAKSLFLANMSHEIRTPLNGILGFLEILKTTEITPEQEEYINTIAQSAKNLLQIVNNILDVSKIESNKVTLEIIDFKSLEEFETTLEIFATPTAQKHIQYATHISPNIPKTLKGDILKVKEILTNLINNAIKFTNKNGTISVKILLEKIEGDKASIYFEVKDTGIGMSEEQKERIFEAFAQADESVTRKYGGTGLGLTIVKNYLEMMGSKINVESEVNKGSVFYFTIDFEIADATPSYKENIFSDLTFAILNTATDTLRKEYSTEYIKYFGAARIGFNTKEELLEIAENEKINAVIVFPEESNKEELIKLQEVNIPLLTISSFALKDYTEKIEADVTIFDPVTPTKTYSTFETIKENKIVSKQERVKKEEEEKRIYDLSVLIAEDNPINQKLLQVKLKNMGIKADIANNGLEAFNKYSMNPEKYDIILMDAQMPIMDGIEATKEILEFEKEEGIPHTPIVAVTANAMKGDREKFIGAGMDDYISKPIEEKELLRVLENTAKNKYSSKPSQEMSKEEKKEEKPKKPSIVVATESQFLVNYLKSLLNMDFEIAKTPKELTNKLKPNTILLIEEDFNSVDIQALIHSLKSKYNDLKIYTIGSNHYKETDGIIRDLNADILKYVLNI